MVQHKQVQQKPKLSYACCFVPFKEAIPIPKDKIKGTVDGPVVTPPASKAIAKNSLGLKNIKTIINA